MKKPILLTTFGLAAALILSNTYLYSSKSGANPGYTGAPGESNCTACHSGSSPVSNNSAVSITLLDNDVSVNEYTPGKTYDIQISITDHSVNSFGFQSTVKQDFQFKGTISESAADVQVTHGNSNYVTHVNSASISHGIDSWTYQWTAPPIGTGEVKIYSAVNAANGNNQTSGDKIYLNSRAVAESPSSAIAEELFDQNLRMWPNPVKDFLTVDYVMNKPADMAIDIFSLNGKLLSSAISKEKVAGNDRVYVDMTKLQSGVFVVKMTADDQVYTRKVFKTSF